MTRVVTPRLSVSSFPHLAIAIERWANANVTQLNALAEERLVAHHAATDTPPTLGDHARGDFTRNAVPEERGDAGSKYVILGWVCTLDGNPGIWMECRCLTGG